MLPTIPICLSSLCSTNSLLFLSPSTIESFAVLLLLSLLVRAQLKLKLGKSDKDEQRQATKAVRKKSINFGFLSCNIATRGARTTFPSRFIGHIPCGLDRAEWRSKTSLAPNRRYHEILCRLRKINSCFLLRFFSENRCSKRSRKDFLNKLKCPVSRRRTDDSKKSEEEKISSVFSMDVKRHEKNSFFASSRS